MFFHIITMSGPRGRRIKILSSSSSASAVVLPSLDGLVASDLPTLAQGIAFKKLAVVTDPLLAEQGLADMLMVPADRAGVEARRLAQGGGEKVGVEQLPVGKEASLRVVRRLAEEGEMLGT